jgi:hypothetical protein
MPKVKYVEQLTRKAKRAHEWKNVLPVSKIIGERQQHVSVHQGTRY